MFLLEYSPVDAFPDRKNRQFFGLTATAEFNCVIKDIQHRQRVGDRVLFHEISQESIRRIVFRTGSIVLKNSHQYKEILMNAFTATTEYLM